MALADAKEWRRSMLWPIPWGLCSTSPTDWPMRSFYLMSWNSIESLVRNGLPDMAFLLGGSEKIVPAEQGAKKCIKKIISLSRSIGIPKNLKELGIPKKAIRSMAEGAIKVARPIENNPRPITVKDISWMLVQCRKDVFNMNTRSRISIGSSLSIIFDLATGEPRHRGQNWLTRDGFRADEARRSALKRLKRKCSRFTCIWSCPVTKSWEKKKRKRSWKSWKPGSCFDMGFRASEKGATKLRNLKKSLPNLPAENTPWRFLPDPLPLKWPWPPWEWVLEMRS